MNDSVIFHKQVHETMMVFQNWDITVLKIIMILGGSVSSVLGYNKLGYSGAGVLSCLISAFTTATMWRKRDTIHDFVRFITEYLCASVSFEC